MCSSAGADVVLLLFAASCAFPDLPASIVAAASPCRVRPQPDLPVLACMCKHGATDHTAARTWRHKLPIRFVFSVMLPRCKVATRNSPCGYPMFLCCILFFTPDVCSRATSNIIHPFILWNRVPGKGNYFIITLLFCFALKAGHCVICLVPGEFLRNFVFDYHEVLPHC